MSSFNAIQLSPDIIDSTDICDQFSCPKNCYQDAENCIKSNVHKTDTTVLNLAISPKLWAAIFVSLIIPMKFD